MDKPTLGVAIPNIFVANLAVALAYYTGPLGFRSLFVDGETPFYAQVQRDAAILALRHLTRKALDHTAAIDLLSAFIEVTQVDALFAAMQSAGAVVFQPPRDEPWGMRSFIVSDPDGNLVCFAAPLPRTA